MQGQFVTAARRLGALPRLPPNRTFGCFVAAAQLMLSVAALFGGMPTENLSVDRRSIRTATPALGARWGELRSDLRYADFDGHRLRALSATAVPRGSPPDLARLWHGEHLIRSSGQTHAGHEATRPGPG